jgi:opacity protein-like surface antigen
MIRKFVVVPGFWIVLGAMSMVTILTETPTACAQQTDQQPAQAGQQQPDQQPQSQSQQPENQQSSSQESTSQQSTIQEATPEETARRVKPRGFDKWNFNAGVGASLLSGTTQKFVRGGGGVGDVGVARNYSKYFGLRADFQWDNLPLKSTALELAQAPGATSHVYSLMADMIFNVPVAKTWGGYIVVGPSFYHRSGKLDSSSAVPGSACNAFYAWWGPCFGGSLPINGNFLHESQNEFGENLGGGVTRKLTSKIEIYAEYRVMHGSYNHRTTDLRPITIGVRW